MRLPYLFIMTACFVNMPAVAQPGGDPPVNVAKVIEREVRTGQTLVGTVHPTRRSIVGSAVDGRVTEFLVNDGDFVKKSQPLAQLLTETLKLQLAASQAELLARQEELRELENGTRKEELDQAKAEFDAAKVTDDLAQTRLRRVREMYDKRTASEDDIELATSTMNRTKLDLIAAKAGYDLAVAGPREERIAQARARAAVQEQEVLRIADQIKKHTIVAPFDGWIVAEHTEQGQWLGRGEPVAEVIELSQVDIKVMVPEQFVRSMNLKSSARIELTALPGETITGTIHSIVPLADLRSRSFPVHIRVPNQIGEDGLLFKAGMFARVTLPTGKPHVAKLVHKDALVLGGPAPRLFVCDLSADKGSATVNPMPVSLGVADGDYIEIEGNVQVGSTIVVSGNERLRPAQTVRIIQTDPEKATPSGG